MSEEKSYPWVVHPMYAAGVTGVLSREDASLEELQALQSCQSAFNFDHVSALKIDHVSGLIFCV